MRCCVLLAACAQSVDAGSESESEGEARYPDSVCPGDDGCIDEGDGVLYVGAAARDITPRDFETWVNREGDSARFDGDIGEDPNCPWSAVDPVTRKPTTCERDCTSEPGDSCDQEKLGDCFNDDDGDGCFDAVWIAGYGEGRAAAGVQKDDAISARCAVLSYNATRLALCAVDFVGYFLDDVVAIRAALDPAWQIDLLLVSATHDHQGPDTLGIWGPDFNITGTNVAYMGWVREQIVDAVGEATRGLVAANITVGEIDTIDEDGVRHFVSDTREPTALTPTLHVFRFAEAKTDETVATLVNWAAHPEYAGSSNLLISADFPNTVRRDLEAELGGTALYVSGPLGGQVGPGAVCSPETCPNEEPAGFAKAERVGHAVADFALRALEEGSVTEESAALAFRTKQTFAQVQNTLYHTAALLGIFPRSMHHWDPSKPVDFDVLGTPLGEAAEGNVPDVLTELVSLRIGRAHILTIPGELHPELYLGCYETDEGGYSDCSYNWPLLFPKEMRDPEYVPPDLGAAPPPPYLIDLLDDDPDEADVDYRMVFGLTPDMLGYMMPLFNFQLGDVPYVEDAPGDHYEETNSIGPTAETQVISASRRLLCWRADGTMSAACKQLQSWGFTPPASGVTDAK